MPAINTADKLYFGTTLVVRAYMGDVLVWGVLGGGWDNNLWDINIWDETSDDVVPGDGAYWNSGQKWDDLETKWLGRGWSSGIAKWSNADDDWKT